MRTVGHGQIDLVDGDRVTVTRSIRLALQELLVVVVVMELVESGRQAEVSQLDVSTAIEQDVIGFNVSSVNVSVQNDETPPRTECKPTCE